MTIKTMGQSIKAKLFAAVVFATCVFTIAANAQPRFVGKFTLPYEVQWNHAVLPAGEYSMRMDSREIPAVVRSSSSNRSHFIAVPTIADCKTGGANLLITIRGNEHRVRSLNLPALGVSLVYKPLTRTEREILTKEGHLEAVPVVIATK